MVRTVLLVSAIALAAGGVQAADTTPKPAATVERTATTTSADASKLIGQDIQNTENQTIGEIKSVRIGASGQVDAVIIGVGGFLGLGEREVALDWKDLRIADDGRKVTVAMTKDQLKAMPEYKYADASYRGRVFSDAAPRDTRIATPADRTAPAVVPADRTAAAPVTADRTAPAARSRAAGDFNAKGEISGNALIGASVKNAANETVGEVEDVFLDQTGAIKGLIVSVGGAMGIGSKDVVMAWQDLKVGRQQDKLVLTTSATKESLKSMPEYKK
jgi:sporulation protein YlmC with PRC-barrel domain